MITKPILRKAPILRLLIPLYLIITAYLHVNAFEVDGLYYKILDDSSVEVISGSSKYTGDIIIPETVKYNGTSYPVISIGKYAFDGCKGLSYITIPNSVISLEEFAFRDCVGLTSVIIPNSVTSIGNFAFSACSGLTSLELGESVEIIGDRAFSRCKGLNSVTIPNSVTTIKYCAFEECPALKEINILSLESWCNINFQGTNSNPLTFVHNLYLNGELIKNLILPESVSEIKTNAFEGCSCLESVTLPNSVTYIGDSAFNGCNGLTSFFIPNSVTYIGDGAFFGCSGISAITIPNSVTYIGSSVFKNCSEIKKVKFEDGNEKVELAPSTFCAFKSCPLEDVYLGRDLYYGYPYAPFSEQTNLTKLTIGKSVKYIWGYEFSGCTNLTSVIIPNSVTYIGQNAFEGCFDLSSITLGESIESIRENAFKNCTSLSHITSLAINPPSVYNSCFENDTYQTATLEVLPEALDAYKEHPVWGKFLIKDLSAINDIENPEDDFSFSVVGGSILVNAPEGKKIDIYNIGGNLVRSTTDQTIDGITPGIYILRHASKSHKLLIK
ncbi:MAG: leucine-rich repeat domain-containing protein [Muribaculaceae bacterium]|nr:leucine-rich repeat domain-containing protein [Muribaculaceae bacterium]